MGFSDVVYTDMGAICAWREAPCNRRASLCTTGGLASTRLLFYFLGVVFIYLKQHDAYTFMFTAFVLVGHQNGGPVGFHLVPLARYES